MLSVYADPYLNANTLNVFQKLEAKRNALLKALRVQIIVFGNPNFSGIEAALYTLKNGLPCQQIAISDSEILKNEMTTTGNGLREIYFTFFEPFGLRLLKDEEIAVCLDVKDYVPSDSSFLALVRAWPRPIYETSYIASNLNPNSAPYAIGVIGGDDGL